MNFKAGGRTVMYAGWGEKRCGVESGPQVPAVLRDRKQGGVAFKFWTRESQSGNSDPKMG